MQRQLSEVVLMVGDAVVTPTAALKNLGVTMDQNLTWAEHVSEIAQKCNKIVFPLIKQISNVAWI